MAEGSSVFKPTITAAHLTLTVIKYRFHMGIYVGSTHYIMKMFQNPVSHVLSTCLTACVPNISS